MATSLKKQIRVCYTIVDIDSNNNKLLNKIIFHLGN